jgi:hypothetical protein
MSQAGLSDLNKAPCCFGGNQVHVECSAVGVWEEHGLS